MSRRARGRPVHGWLIVDKPAGPTSAAVVAKAKWALDAAKAGHAGTLDPAATGLLAIAFGEATKTVPFIADARKAYRFTVRWGAATSTDDAEGAVLATSDARPDAAAIARSAPRIHRRHPAGPAADLRGQGRRRPRLHAGPRRRGARSRASPAPGRAARAHRHPRPRHRRPRDDLRQGRLRPQPRPRPRRAPRLPRPRRRASAGSGPAPSPSTTPSTGRRCEATPRGSALESRGCCRCEAALAGLPGLACPAQAAERLLNGNAVPLPDPGLAPGALAWASHDGRPLALGVWRGGALHPSRVFRLG